MYESTGTRDFATKLVQRYFLSGKKLPLGVENAISRAESLSQMSQFISGSSRATKGPKNVYTLGK